MSALKFLYREVECEHGCCDVSSECISDYEVICDHYECEKLNIDGVDMDGILRGGR